MMTKVSVLVIAMLVSTSRGMRLEPGGKYTGVTLVVSDDVPDHDCEEMLAKLKVNSSKIAYPDVNSIQCIEANSKAKIQIVFVKYQQHYHLCIFGFCKKWGQCTSCVLAANHIKCLHSHARKRTRLLILGIYHKANTNTNTTHIKY